MATGTQSIPTASPSRTSSEVILILDRSGSMEACRDATISGFNEYVQTVRQAAERQEIKTRITLTVFNHDVQVKEFRSPLGRLRRISRGTYVPGGNTAMLDAVGETLDRLVTEVRNPHDRSFLVCIISDGLENASRHYSYADVAERIQRLTAEENWTFTYLGSNQDLATVTEQLHIPRGNVAEYDSSPTGTNRAWRRHSLSTMNRMADLRAGIPSSPTYFVPDEADESSS
jgi:uncharacterized protein YegL